jgi:hypothetical protein
VFRPRVNVASRGREFAIEVNWRHEPHPGAVFGEIAALLANRMARAIASKNTWRCRASMSTCRSGPRDLQRELIEHFRQSATYVEEEEPWSSRQDLAPRSRSLPPPTKSMGQDGHGSIADQADKLRLRDRQQVSTGAPMWRRAPSAAARQGRSLTISIGIMPPATKTNSRLRYNYGGPGFRPTN